MVNLYELLGLPTDATENQIRQHIMQHHAAGTLDEKYLNAAKDWLLNPDIRQKYDAKLAIEFPQSNIIPSIESEEKEAHNKKENSNYFKKIKVKNGYVKDNLVPGEQVYYQASIAWISQLPMLILAFILLFLPPFFIVSFILIAFAVINVKTTELALTNKRIVAKYGFIRRQTIEINIKKIESIQVSQGLLGRLFGYGSIKVNGTGGNFAPVPYINNPLEFRGFVNTYIDHLDGN